jgi:hypothetical protein
LEREDIASGPGREGFTGYAGNETRVKSFVEAWLRFHEPNITGWRKIGGLIREEWLEHSDY